MHYSSLLLNDTMNGPGMRVVLFVSGCRHKCKGCFNEQTWDFQYGDEFTDETLERILLALGDKYIQGLSILGGEPLDPRNAETVASIFTACKARYPDKDYWCWTGSTLSELQRRVNAEDRDAEAVEAVLNTIDVLVDGKFEQELFDPTLKYRGSSNQNVIEVRHV